MSSSTIETLSQQDCQVLMTGQSAMPDFNNGLHPHCMSLEQGGILFLQKSPFLPEQADLEFLLKQKQLSAGYHKNIAFKPRQRKLSGVKLSQPEDMARLQQILEQYSQQTTRFLEAFLTPYKHHWQLDYTSFRPLEENNRRLRLRARNDLLHVDSFPTRPTRGGRILRVFTNIHPSKDRIWQTSWTFEQLLKEYKYAVRRYHPGQTHQSPSLFTRITKIFGGSIASASAYDNWMLNFHNFLKENQAFQSECPKKQWVFPPGSAWLVYTDMVSHSVLSGQSAMEQTFIVSPQAMVMPEKTPIQLLEKTYEAS